MNFNQCPVDAAPPNTKLQEQQNNLDLTNPYHDVFNNCSITILQNPDNENQSNQYFTYNQYWYGDELLNWFIAGNTEPELTEPPYYVQVKRSEDWNGASCQTTPQPAPGQPMPVQPPIFPFHMKNPICCIPKQIHPLTEPHYFKTPKNYSCNLL